MSPVQDFKKSIMVFYWISMCLTFPLTAPHKSLQRINWMKKEILNHENMIRLQSNLVCLWVIMVKWLKRHAVNYKQLPKINNKYWCND